jgi:hypothetical protein
LAAALGFSIRLIPDRLLVQNGGTSGFGAVIAINPTKDAAIFIGMNQVGAQLAMKAIEILRHLP